MSELVSNRKAFYSYEILETFETGIILLGTEVKSLKAHHGNLQDAYIIICDGEVILKNSSISPYKFGSVYNHEERRDRKLLLHKGEIEKLKKISSEKGLTLIPLSFYLKKGMIKVKIASVRGKKQHDKREAIREREDQKKIQRILKEKSR